MVARFWSPIRVRHRKLARISAKPAVHERRSPVSACITSRWLDKDAFKASVRRHSAVGQGVHGAPTRQYHVLYTMSVELRIKKMEKCALVMPLRG